MSAGSHKFESVIETEDDLPQVAAELLKFAGPVRIFLMNGEMGSGKTTFIKALCRVLGSEDHFSSPTFSLVNEYHSPVGKIYHLDLYRIHLSDELLDFGIDEMLDSGNYCFIEWPSKVLEFIESNFVEVTISVSDNRRVFNAIHRLEPKR